MRASKAGFPGHTPAAGRCAGLGKGSPTHGTRTLSWQQVVLLARSAEAVRDGGADTLEWGQGQVGLMSSSGGQGEPLPLWNGKVGSPVCKHAGVILSITPPMASDHTREMVRGI